MLHYPDTMRKAQAEIDEVVGTDRLPTLAERERLPYFEALFTEVLRVYTFGPIGSFIGFPQLDTSWHRRAVFTQS